MVGTSWYKAAGIRALKTFCQSVLSLVTVGNAITDMDWVGIVSISATAALVSILTSVVGLPEVKEDKE